MKAWMKVIVLGLGKWPMKVASWFVVPFLNDYDRKYHQIWGAEDADDLSWRNIAWRNGVHNLTTRVTPPFDTKGNTLDHTLEALDGFQWRYRRSLNNEYVSFRMTWGKPRAGKGKREFYVGWTMNESDTMRLTFFQLRVF